jgi:hypothetical protein
VPPARPKRLRFTVFTLAGRLLLRVGAEAERLAGLIAARGQLLRLAHAPPVG